MSEKERVPGCGNYDSFRGTCRLIEDSNFHPSLAEKSLIIPPGEIEGPGLATTLGLICLAGEDAVKQMDCSGFKVRTTTDNIADENW